MKRRSFLQLSGMSLATSMLAGCRKGNEKLLPFLVPPDDGISPGTANYYASTCRQCPAGCGILVRVSEGRAKKIEGNPRHPLNQGKLCARGQAMLQELYHPDRIKQPLARSGPRGSGEYTPISWDAALQQLAEDLAPYRQSSSAGMALLTAPLRGSMATLTQDFLRHFPGATHLAWEPLHPEWLAEGMLGELGSPDYDIENTQYLLSFGADFLESHLSPVRYGQGFGQFRQARPTIRGRFSYIGPRLSMTAASADRWLPAKSGSEWALALGIARRLLQTNRQDPAAMQAAGLSAAEIANLVAAFDEAKVAEITGVNLADIRTTIDEAVSISPALAIVGEMVAWQSNAPAAIAAVELLNVMLGNLNKAGGIYYSPTSSAQLSSGYGDLQRLIGQMEQGQLQLALVYGSNPVYSLPPSSQFQQAFAKVPRIVSFASFLDDTSRQADLILPGHSNLESWGDIIPPAGVRSEVIGLMQPVVKPLHDTLAFPDLLLAAAKALGGELAQELPQNSYLEYLETDLTKRIPALSTGDSRQQLDRLLQQGGWFGPESEPARLGRLMPAKLPDEAEFAGAAEQFPLQLQIYPSINYYDGRSSHLPWLQQLPDPMSTAVWGSWLEINPQTAAQLGIAQGELVEVSSAAGSIQLPAVLYPGLRPEVVACPLGQGHSGGGRYAEGRGTNPLQLLAQLENLPQPRLNLGATRVRIKPLAQAGALATSGHPEGSYRRELLGL